MPFTKVEYENIDEDKEYSNVCLASFGTVTDFQVHARITVLSKNFSPPNNRNHTQIQVCKKVSRGLSRVDVSLNGGVDTISGAKEELDRSIV